jgi:L-ascorbate metabolism protein UlaG (beta-lactamase superfamily)
MRIRWLGQSAFLLTGSARVAIDPFGDVLRAPPSAACASPIRVSTASRPTSC